MNWLPDFSERSPLFAPVARAALTLTRHRDWPPITALQALFDERAVVNCRGLPLRLTTSSANTSYEARVYEAGELHVRERNWHDLFNVLVWASYPRTKAALNARHHDAARAEHRAADTLRGNRGRTRDALTLFDESGAIVTSSERRLIQDLEAFRWKDLFWEERPQVKSAMRFYLFGHALLEKALEPYVGITAHAIALDVPERFNTISHEEQLEYLDQRVAELVTQPDAIVTPRSLAPLPVLGVPGWWPANETESFYDDAKYFRAGRLRPSRL